MGRTTRSSKKSTSDSAAAADGDATQNSDDAPAAAAATTPRRKKTSSDINILESDRLSKWAAEVERPKVGNELAWFFNFEDITEEMSSDAERLALLRHCTRAEHMKAEHLGDTYEDGRRAFLRKHFTPSSIVKFFASSIDSQHRNDRKANEACAQQWREFIVWVDNCMPQSLGDDDEVSPAGILAMALCQVCNLSVTTDSFRHNSLGKDHKQFMASWPARPSYASDKTKGDKRPSGDSQRPGKAKKGRFDKSEKPDAADKPSAATTTGSDE